MCGRSFRLWWMLGGDHLLVVVARRAAVGAAEAFDLGDAAWGHDDAAPAAAGKLEHGPDEAERAGFAREAADHLGAAADFDEGALEQIRNRYERAWMPLVTQGPPRR